VAPQCSCAQDNRNVTTAILFVTGDPPRTEGWSVNVLHATAFLTESDAEAAFGVHRISDARGCQQIYDFWYVFK
jgi:hypothetical protein